MKLPKKYNELAPSQGKGRWVGFSHSDLFLFSFRYAFKKAFGFRCKPCQTQLNLLILKGKKEVGKVGVNPKLLEKLVCPKCKGQLTMVGDNEALDCYNCGLRYKIEKYPNDVYIPNMIIEQAEPIPKKQDGNSQG